MTGFFVGGGEDGVTNSAIELEADKYAANVLISNAEWNRQKGEMRLRFGEMRLRSSFVFSLCINALRAFTKCFRIYELPKVRLDNIYRIQNTLAAWAKNKGFNEWIVIGRLAHETGMWKFRKSASRNIN